MLFDLGKIIGGPGEGDGPVGALINLFGGLAVLGGGGAAAVGSMHEGAGADVAEGIFTKTRGGAAAEGIFARLWRVADIAADLGFDYTILSDLLRNRQGGFKDHFKDLSEPDKNVLEAATGHSFLRGQLELHKNENSIKPLVEEYRALGLNLPSEGLLNKTYRRLSPLMHPDKHPDATNAKELMQALNNARDVLRDPAKQQDYGRELSRNRKKMEALFEKLSDHEMKGAAKAAFTPKALLPGEVAQQSWFSELSRAKQSGIVFAGVAATAIGVYWVTQKLEARRKLRVAANHNAHSHAARYADGLSHPADHATPSR